MKIRVVTFLLLAVIFAAMLSGCINTQDYDVPQAQTEYTQSQPTETEPIPTEALPTTPDESGAIVSKIPDYNSNSAAQEGEVDSNGITLPYKIEGTDLVITAMGGYTGAYVEDIEDEFKQGVFSIVVQNKSEKDLLVASIVIKDDEGNSYRFKLSTLPSMKSALVMESTAQRYAPEINIEEISASKNTCGEFEMSTDKIEVSFDGKNIRIKNLTDTDFSAVYVRYKNFTYGNVYLGGITYSATFNTVDAKGEYTYASGHYNLKNSEILIVEVIE